MTLYANFSNSLDSDDSLDWSVIFVKMFVTLLTNWFDFSNFHLCWYLNTCSDLKEELIISRCGRRLHFYSLRLQIERILYGLFPGGLPSACSCCSAYRVTDTVVAIFDCSFVFVQINKSLLFTHQSSPVIRVSHVSWVRLIAA